MPKIDVGGGEVPKEGFINVDAYYPKADVKAFADNLPYETDSVQSIYCSHTLEHVAKVDVIKVLREFYRVLKPLGDLVLRVPDLEWCCRRWLENQTTGWDMDIIFGHQNSPGEFHKTGFTRRIGIDYLHRAKFIIDKIEELKTHGQKTLSFECHKE